MGGLFHVFCFRFEIDIGRFKTRINCKPMDPILPTDKTNNSLSITYAVTRITLILEIGRYDILPKIKKIR